MRIDIIIIADSTLPELRTLTQDAINSVHTSSDGLFFDVMVIETSKETIDYVGSTVIKNPYPEFNYNQLLNLGINLTGNQFIFLCNNDILFHKGIVERIIERMGDKYYSASPYTKNYHEVKYPTGDWIREGYRIGHELTGWCICINRKIIRYIGLLREDCQFWYSDHVYAEQLQRAGLKHIFVGDAYIEHLQSRTIDQEPNADRYYDLTVGQKQFLDKYIDSPERP